MRPAIALGALLLLGGCSLWGSHPAAPAPGLVARTAAAVDRMVQSAPGIGPDATILVASIAEAADLSRPSPLGRVISEEIGTRLVALGFRVPEIRLTDTLHVNERGAFILSNSAYEIRRLHTAEVVATGTIAEFAGNDYVNLRLVRLADGLTISAATFVVPSLTAAQMSLR